LDKEEYKLVMLVGNYSAWNMESSLTDEWKESEAKMLLSELSSMKLALGNTFLVVALSIWNPVLWTKSVLELTDNCTTLTN
jgi:hypothetical protein